MVLIAFVWFAVWGIGSAALFALGWVLVYCVQGSSAASELANAWFFTFNGILAGAAGYGAVFFLRRERKTLVATLKNVLDVPQVMQYEFTRRLQHVISWRVTHLVAILLTLIGGLIAYRAGIPLRGFAHLYLTGAVVSFYFVGAYGVMVIIAVLYLFRFIEQNGNAAALQRISIKAPFRGLEIHTIDLFFVISSGMCIFAVYVCFRTTLSAFALAPLFYYKAMIVPVFFFLPAALVYSFYPRYVLRQVWEADTFVAIDLFASEMAVSSPIDMKANLEIRKLILEVKERMLAERRTLPLFSLRDAPTLTMSLLMLIQLVMQKDPVIAGWFLK